MEQPPRNAATPEHLLAFARSMRKAPTDAGDRVWSLLRNRRFLGLKFRREHPVPPYILDFYCDELSWAIELDGGHHHRSETRTADAERTAELAERGITVTRFWNHDVLNDPDAIVAALFRTATTLRSRT